MCAIAQWRPLDGCSLLNAIVPEHNLSRVCAAKNQIWVELGKARRHDGTLTMKHVLWCLFFEFCVPHDDNAIRFIWTFFVVVIGSYHQFWEMGRPIE
jgi:hypothetical protein